MEIHRYFTNGYPGIGMGLETWMVHPQLHTS